MNAARMCVGAFSSALLDVLPRPVLRDDPLERSLEVARDRRVGVLVDRHARGRVRDVDERGAAPSSSPSAAFTSSVMSTSWLRFCVVTLNSRTARILGSVAEGTFSDRELDGYRSGADRFIAELDEEYYLHYAGLKPEFELRAIYERHADLTDLATIKRLGETVKGKENLELFRFGCEGYLGELTRENAEKIAELEAKLEIQHEGEPVGYRMLPPTIANTADRDTRARLEQSRNELTEEHLNPLYLDAVHATQRAVPELGAPTYFHLYRDRFDYDLEGLAGQCRAFLDSTERLYEESMDRVLPRARRRRPRRSGALRHPSLLPRLELGQGVPGRPDAAGAPRHARRTSGSISTRSRMSISTSRNGRRRARGPSARRSRSPAR